MIEVSMRKVLLCLCFFGILLQIASCDEVLNVLSSLGKLSNVSVAIIGSRKVGAEHDIRNTEWIKFAPLLSVVGFEADANSVFEMNTAWGLGTEMRWKEEHVAVALSNTIGRFTLYETADPQCSSLLPPNTALTSRYRLLADVLPVRHKHTVETTTLDAWLHERTRQQPTFRYFDYIQVDVQGMDLAVLEGARFALQHALAVQVEVEFIELYKGQPLFADVDSFMRRQGFTLFDLKGPYRFTRVKSPIVSATAPGQVAAADAVYLRDLVPEASQHSTQRLLTLACVADALGLSDYAVEVLEVIREREGRGSGSFLDFDVAGEILRRSERLTN